MASAVNLPLRDVNGSSVGILSISALPRSDAPQNLAEDPARSWRGPAIQLREATAYRYKLDLEGVSTARMEPVEIFDPDDSSGTTGRLYTRQYVGDVWLTAFDAAGRELASGAVLVKAAKLEHEREYQRMLRERHAGILGGGARQT